MFIRSVLRSAAPEGGGGAPSAPAPAAPEPATQAAEPAADPPAPGSSKPSQRTNRHDLKARTAGELKAMIARESAGEGSPRSAEPAATGNDAAIEDAPTDAAEKAAKAIDKAGGDVPEQREGESDKRYELRLAKALQDLRDAETSHRKEKTAREAAEKRATDHEAAIKRYEQRAARWKDKAAALDTLMEEADLSLEDIVKGINDGTIKPPRSRASLPPEVAAEMERLRKADEERAAEVKRLREADEAREQERMTAKQREQFDVHIKQASKWLEDNADDYPLTAATSWAPSSVVRGAYEKNGDMAAPAREMEDALSATTLALIGNDRALKALAKRDPAIKAKIAAALGLGTTQPANNQTQPAAEPAKEKKPAAKPVSKVSTEATTPERARVRELNRHDRLRSASAALRNHLRAQNER